MHQTDVFGHLLPDDFQGISSFVYFLTMPRWFEFLGIQQQVRQHESWQRCVVVEGMSVEIARKVEEFIWFILYIHLFFLVFVWFDPNHWTIKSWIPILNFQIVNIIHSVDWMIFWGHPGIASFYREIPEDSTFSSGHGVQFVSKRAGAWCRGILFSL